MLRFALAMLAVCSFAAQSDAQIRLFRKSQPAQAQCTGENCSGAACSTVVAVPYVAAPNVSYSSSSYAVRSSGVTARSFGSSGGLSVGSRDSDGAVISSIGSTVSPSIAKAGTVEQLAFGDRIKFRRSLLAAAKQAREAGDITPAQYFLLSAASRNPNTLDKMQAAVHEAAIEEGLATAQAIDWDALIGFIEKLIPIIIQLIGLFGDSQTQFHHSIELTGFDPYTLAA